MVLSVVFPAFNEENTIEQVVSDHERIMSSLSEHFEDWELVCVDDASTDGTAGILQRLARERTRLRVLTHAENQGIYQSFADLFAASRGTHIYLTASDGQWPADNLAVLLREVENGADLVVGVRGNRQQIYSLNRRIVSALFNLLPRLLFGVRTSDAGSIKLGCREAFTMKLISRSPFVEAERIISAKSNGLRVDFVPITFLSRSAGKERGASWRNIRRSTRDCFRCFCAYRLGLDLAWPERNAS